MNLDPDRHLIYVDGKDTLHVVCHLLQANGVDTEKRTRQFEVEAVGDFKTFFHLVDAHLKAPGRKSVGFIVDAESSVSTRWNQIDEHLKPFGFEMPPAAERARGLVLSHGQTRIGFWVMPDNLHDGAVEEFLNGLVEDGDRLWEHANDATDKAREIDSRFIDNYRRKAVLACWLAWQKDPGNPYGTAITAGYFNPKRPIATDFVSWTRELWSDQTN